MPISVAKCNEDELEVALLNHKEYVSDIEMQAAALLVQLKAQTPVVQSEFLTPMRVLLEQIVAPSGMTVDEVADELQITQGNTREEAETNLAARYGISVVNGRVIVPGSINLETMKIFRTLVGSMEKVRQLIPEIDSFDPASRFSLPVIKSRFIFVISHYLKSDIAATDCQAGSETWTEATLGINISIAAVLAANPSVSVDDLILNIFWVSTPYPSNYNRTTAVKFGLTPDEFIDAVVLKSTDMFKVYQLANPYDVGEIINNFPTDVDDIITRGPTSINPAPTTNDIQGEVDKIMDKPVGAITKAGATDYSSGPMALYNVLDLDKTFGIKKTFDAGDPCYDVTAFGADLEKYLGQVHDVIEKVMQACKAPLQALNSINDRITNLARPVLNELTKLISIVSNLLGDPNFLKCFFGAKFSISLNLNQFLSPLTKLLDLIDTGIGAVFDFLNILNSLLAILSQLSCMASTFASGFNIAEGLISQLSTVLGVRCTFNFKPDYGDCFQAVMDIAQKASQFMMDIMTHLLFSLRSLQMFLVGLSKNLDLSMNSSAEGTICNPATSAKLSALLGTKAILASGAAGTLGIA